MSSPAEDAVALFFHSSRSAAKHARREQKNGFDTMRRALLQRAWLDRFEQAAEREAYERSLD